MTKAEPERVEAIVQQLTKEYCDKLKETLILSGDMRKLVASAFRSGFAHGVVFTAEAATIEDPDGYTAKTFAQARVDHAVKLGLQDADLKAKTVPETGGEVGG